MLVLCTHRLTNWPMFGTGAHLTRNFGAVCWVCSTGGCYRSEAFGLPNLKQLSTEDGCVSLS